MTKQNCRRDMPAEHVPSTEVPPWASRGRVTLGLGATICSSILSLTAGCGSTTDPGSGPSTSKAPPELAFDSGWQAPPAATTASAPPSAATAEVDEAQTPPPPLSGELPRTLALADPGLAPAASASSASAAGPNPLPALAPNVSNCGTGFALYGAIGDKFDSLGGCGNFLGAPAISESGTPDRIGRFNHFINWGMGSIFSPPGSGPSNGSIYYTPQFRAWSIHGAIRGKWAALGWERGLGYPVTDESGTPDGVGRFNHFNTFNNASSFVPPGSSEASNASIYYTPWTGSWSVRGAIRAQWAALGWETGPGYPTSDEYDCGPPSNPDRCSDFEFGTIVWNGAFAEFVARSGCKGQTATCNSSGGPGCAGRGKATTSGCAHADCTQAKKVACAGLPVTDSNGKKCDPVQSFCVYN